MAPDFIDVVFDGPPGPESGRFIEVENAAGASISFGEWVERDDGYWALRIPAPGMTTADLAAATRAFRDAVRASYPEADFHITIEGGGGNGGKRFCSFLRLRGWRSLDEPIIRWGATPDEALQVMREAVDALPRIWSADDVAATIGIVIAPPALDPRDPDPSRPAPFNDHNCARCKSGAQPERCPNPGNPRNCDTLYARND